MQTTKEIITKYRKRKIFENHISTEYELRDILYAFPGEVCRKHLMKTEYADIGIEALALVIAEKYEQYLVANDFF